MKLEIDDKQLSELERRAFKLKNEIGGNAVRLIMGRATQQVVKQHFSELSSDAAFHSSSSKLGANPTGFYLDAADKTQDPQLETGGVSVSVNKLGIAQRIFGGTIVPTTKKWLTIAATAAAYGKRAGEIGEKLRFVLFGPGKAALVGGEKTVGPANRPAGTGTPIGGQIYYWLVKSVTQKPNPKVKPEEDKILKSATENAQSYLERLWKGAATA